jgi:hypothetical protein
MPKQAHEYRRQAALCLEVARRMSMERDRAGMMEMAQRWLDLARELEGQESASKDHPGTMLQQQQPQPPKAKT